MSRLAAAASAMLLGAALSACADASATSSAPPAVKEVASVPCGDELRPCALDAIVVTASRDADAGRQAAEARS